MPKHIMAFNDSKELLLLVEKILSHEGYKVTLETYGVDEYQRIESARPDLVILDCDLTTEEKGWEIIETLKLTETTASIPIVFCVAYTKKWEEIRTHLSTKRVAILPRPYDMNDLLLTIKQAFKLSDVMPEAGTET